MQPDMSPASSGLEEYRDRRVGADRVVRLLLETFRSGDNPHREQANYKNAELVYTPAAAAIREVNVNFEEATAIVQPAGQQLIADRADAVNQSLRAEIRRLVIQLVTAHSLGQRVLAMSRVKLNHTEDIEARLQTRQH